MDLLDQMNASLNYIEDNLDSEIDIAAAAKLAYCSSYHFQRMFSFVTGVPLAEYIRRRRLTLAAIELQNNSVKVIDAALKYGYDSPTAFTRAFINLHGVSPKAAKEKGTKLKSYPRLSFQISIKGDTEMNYRIEEKQGFRLVGYKETVNSENGINFKRIPEIWTEFMKNGMFEKIFKLSNGNPCGIMGVCANFKEKEFDYYCAVSSDKAAPENMSALEVNPSTWVVFECVGAMPKALQDVWKRIFSEWFPSSGYECTDGPEIEWYSEGDNQKDDYKSEIWIPIVKK